MARRVSVLVVANTTASSSQLIEALKARARDGELHATLLMPCTGAGLTGREEARARVEEALAIWREHDLTDVEGVVGDQDPLVAVHETWNPTRYDEIIVSTLPGHASEWLRWDLPHRVARLTDAQVSHVLSTTKHAQFQWEQRPLAPRPPLGPLSVLAWGHPKDETADEREKRLRALRR